MDTSSLFIGVAIGIVGAFGTGFLKKAGEDTYSHLKAKINPKTTTPPSPHIVVQLHNTQDRAKASSASGHLIPEPSTYLTFDAIEKALKSAPPMQREHVAKTFVGLSVEWDAYLRSANKRDNDKVRIRLAVDKQYSGRSVTCTVQETDYRMLGILPEGAHIRAAGQIMEVDACDVELTNVRLKIFPEATLV